MVCWPQDYFCSYLKQYSSIIWANQLFSFFLVYDFVSLFSGTLDKKAQMSLILKICKRKLWIWRLQSIFWCPHLHREETKSQRPRVGKPSLTSGTWGRSLSRRGRSLSGPGCGGTGLKSKIRPLPRIGVRWVWTLRKTINTSSWASE